MEKYDVATGASRMTKTWKNSQLTWEQITERLATTTRTGETMSEYKSMGKAQQDEAKDVGGFVGGYLAQGRRGDVRSRSLVCLDADFATLDTPAAFEVAWPDVACAVYSTHKHSEETPRYRFVIPLDRSVTPDEYQAIARKVADEVGMDLFDDTTYQAQRLMYWPSTSQDGPYFFLKVEGEPLCADSILGMYADWTDVTTWPTSSRTTAALTSSRQRKADPRERDGLVGAFCRAWPIEEAIDAFVDDYERCDGCDDRYTYLKGSTSGGVVVYDGVWSYSHHDTDPASMRLVNAFDLVRLHRFAEEDADAAPGTPDSRLPSTALMLDFAGHDERTGALLYEENAADVLGDFDIDEEPDSDDAEDEQHDKAMKALSGLSRDKRGFVEANYKNVETIMLNDPAFAGKIRLSEFDRMIHVSGPRFLNREVKEYDDTIRDEDSASIRAHVDKVYHLRGKDLLRDCTINIARLNAFHPVRDYLSSLVWDGEPRLGNMLVRWLGCENTDYTRELTIKTMVGAVARVYEPGCKVDNMLVVKGDQGIGKSLIWAKLGGSWFSDSLTSFNDKAAMEAIQGSWIIELAELSAMKKAEAEQIKAFLSKQTDKYRKSYGEHVECYPRQCIFVGTTNESEFLRDTTGNRRFWIVESPKGHKGEVHPWYMSKKDVDALWAEAVAIYNTEGLQELSAAAGAASIEKHRSFSTADDREGQIRDYLDTLLPEDWYRMTVEERRDWFNGYGDGAEGTMRREIISVPEVMYELYGKSVGSYDRYEGIVIGKMIAGFDGWDDASKTLRIPGYGSVKARRRMV